MQKQKHFNLRKLWLSLLLLVGATAIAVPGIQEIAEGSVAKIGSNEYATLQAAVDAAKEAGGSQTINLIADVSGETVTIQEVANFKLTIDGQNKTVDALIIVDGLRGNGGSTTNGASVTIQNIAFVKSTSTDGIQASHYPHNLTIQDCTYTGSDNSKWFFNASTDGPLYGVTIKNVTVEHARLIYANLAEDAVFQNITATNDCTVGFNVKTSGTALIENCKVTTGKYAFRDYSDGYAGSFTLKDNTFISTSEASDEGVIVNRGGGETAHINVESGTYTGHVKVLNNKEGVLAISGGYFTEEFPQNYLSADLVAQGKVCVPATDKEGFFTIGDPHYVAQIGENKFISLQAALDAAHETTGDVTITLIDNIGGYSIVHQKAGLNLTIDGAEKTLAGQIFIDGDGRSTGTETLTIQNFKFEGKGTDFYSGTDAFVFIPQTKSPDTAPYYTGKYNYAHNVTVTNCSFTSTSTELDVVGVKSPSIGGGLPNYVITGCSGSNLHSLAQLRGMDGGEITNNTVSVSESFVNISDAKGEFTISGNTFTLAEGADGYAIRENANSSAVINLSDNSFTAAKAVVLGKGASATNGTINVVSGTYVGDIVKDIATSATGKIVISGGQFSTDLTNISYEPFIAEGKIGVLNNALEGAPYSVEDGTYVAQVTLGESTHMYGSLEAAIAAAADGSTVTLLADCTGNGIKVPQGKYTTGLTVDFDGHTYTMDGSMVGSTGTETQAFQLLKDNTITFKNGTITSEKAKILVQNYSNLTLEGMTLTLNNTNYTSAYTLSNNNGNVVIDGTTINANPAGGFAFDVCRYSGYPSVSVTVTGESVINGDVEVSASGNDAKDGFSLMLESGNITGNIIVAASARAAIEATPDKAVIKEKDSFNQAAPAGFKWVSNGDDTSTLTPMPYVAQIGDVKYWSLADAVAAVPADGTETTITMIANEMVNVVGSAITIPATKNVILDLNGYQVVGTAAGGSTSALITNRGTLTIKDSSDTNSDGTGTGKLISGATTTWVYDGSDDYSGSYASNTINNNGTLTIESGYIQNISTGSATYAVDNNSNGVDAILNMKGGLLTAKGTVVRQFCNSTTKQNVINMEGGVITTTGYTAIWTQLPGSNASSKKLATLNITGGEVTGGTYAWYDYSFGDSFEAVDYNISGGKLTGYIFSYAIYNSVIDGFISGGLFSEEVDEEYIADGCIFTTNTDPATKDAYPYIVKEGKFVCAIGTTKYESLEEAWNAVQDGETITLLDNCAGNGIKAPQGKFTTGITVDFAGFTYTMDGAMVGSTGTETQAFQLLKDNKITFKNGTIYSEKALMLIQNYSDLTLEGMTLTLNNENYDDGYTLSNNNGNIVIDGTTINANPAGSTAFDVCRYASYTSVNVTVKGESVINGDIEFDAGSGDPKDGANLTIEGGTITGNLRLTSGGSTALTDHADKAVVTKSDAVELAAPADYKWVSNGDGTSTLAPCEYVAQIEGGAKYESLEAAWAAVEDGQTITLLANTSGNGIKAPQGKFTTGITVDFAGFTYTMDGSMVGSTGTQTQACQLLKDNKITFKNGTIYSEKALMLIQNYSDLTLEGMTLTLNNENYDDGYTLSNNNGNIVIDGTTINANPAGSTAFDVCRYASYTSVNVTVKGESVINGDIEFDAGSGDPKDGANLTIEGGTITGNLRLTSGGSTALTDHSDNAAVTKNDAVELAAPENFKWVSNGDGTSTLMPCDYICAIGTTKYETLAEAVAAAGTAETTITLLTEAATDGVISGDGVVVPSGSNITFDLNGLTYDASGVTVGSTNTKTQGFQLLKESNITFKNGTLKATSPTAKMLIQNYSNLTLEDVNLDGTGLSGVAYALSNNSGTINLTGSTSITAKEGGRAFDTCKFGSYAIPTVNINTTGTITGPIEATGGKLNIEDGKFNVTWVTDNNYSAGDIQITGGIFTAEPAEEYCAEGFISTENTDEATMDVYPYAVMSKEDAGIFELIDGEVYPYLDYTEDKAAASVTYKRIFKNTSWQALFVPFDINDVTELTDRYEFAKIHMVALENDGTYTTGNKIEIYYTRVTSGKISANQPYLIKAKTSNEEEYQTIVVENTILKDTHNMRPRKTSTMAADYVFTGTYEGYTGQKQHDFMAMGKGTINWGNKNDKVGTYRWYIKVEPYGDDYAKPSISFIEADEDATSISAASTAENDEIEGYYTVNGVRSDVPVKGMNIVKYKNGKTKKIMIK